MRCREFDSPSGVVSGSTSLISGENDYTTHEQTLNDTNVVETDSKQDRKSNRQPVRRSRARRATAHATLVTRSAAVAHDDENAMRCCHFGAKKKIKRRHRVTGSRCSYQTELVTANHPANRRRCVRFGRQRHLCRRIRLLLRLCSETRNRKCMPTFRFQIVDWEK
jgi:hypothetical protein